MGRTLFVGIDIGADTNVVRIIDDNDNDVCGFSVSNDLPGTERLVEKVVDVADTLPADKVKIGMEATNLYWWHLSQALHDDPQLTALGTEIAVINPKISMDLRIFILIWLRQMPWMPGLLLIACGLDESVQHHLPT